MSQSQDATDGSALFHLKGGQSVSDGNTVVEGKWSCDATSATGDFRWELAPSLAASGGELYRGWYKMGNHQYPELIRLQPGDGEQVTGYGINLTGAFTLAGTRAERPDATGVRAMSLVKTYDMHKAPQHPQCVPRLVMRTVCSKRDAFSLVLACAFLPVPLLYASLPARATS